MREAHRYDLLSARDVGLVCCVVSKTCVGEVGGTHRVVCEQRVRAKRTRLLDTGLSVWSVKRKQDYIKIITHTHGRTEKYLHVFQKFSRVR